MNKADKCSAICTKHTWAAVSSALQENSFILQVHDLWISKLFNNVMHKTDTMQGLY